jgi:hypothetical protein
MRGRFCAYSLSGQDYPRFAGLYWDFPGDQSHCPALGQSSQDPGNLNRFELLIDWGWFHFITKPLFLAMDWIYQKVGNFASALKPQGAGLLPFRMKQVQLT